MDTTQIPISVFAIIFVFLIVVVVRVELSKSLELIGSPFSIIFEIGRRPKWVSTCLQWKRTTGGSHDNFSKFEAADLLTGQQVETRFDTTTWQRSAYDEFRQTILTRNPGQKTFPCVYATIGFRDGGHRYVFLSSEDPSEPSNVQYLAAAIRAYLRISHSLGSNTSLVVFAAPTTGQRKSVEDYNRNFWDTLHGLRALDNEPWPADVPQCTDSERWTFCFDGEPIFPIALTPAHSDRWSRHASVPVIAMQPKWVLDKLLGSVEGRASATRKVRKLLGQYDRIDISPDLSQYGEMGTREARQLCLLDENITAECPYRNFDMGPSLVLSS